MEITVNSRKYDGSIRRSWHCEYVSREGPLLTFSGVFDQDVEHSDLGFIKKGTISHEYYWLDRWYNVFRFYESDGTFRNYYCNINMPPTFGDGVLDYVDLDLDVIVDKDYCYQILDREDFAKNTVIFSYPEDITAKAEQTLDELIKLIETRHFPFDENSFDL